MLSAPFLPSARELADHTRRQHQAANTSARLAALEARTPRVDALAIAAADRAHREQAAIRQAYTDSLLAFSREQMARQHARLHHGR